MTVYLDNNASTALHPEVLDEMLPFLQVGYGNASSLHRSGRFRRSAIETARQRIATLSNASPEQIIFTSGGTEANNLALKGFLPMNDSNTIVASAIEHASVLEPLQQAAKDGCRTALLRVSSSGVIDIAAAKALISDMQPDLVSVQLANNETGVIQPVEDIAKYCRGLGNSIVHSDVTQAISKLGVDFSRIGADLLTISAHKFGGPQGVGALVARKGIRVKNPLISGGYQEGGQRAGTENVAALVGFGKAAEMAQRNLQETQTYLLELRRYFEEQLKNIPGVQIFGEQAERLVNTSYFAIPYYHGETLLMQLDKAGFELASGSACHSEVTQPSHVLTAMGVTEELALNAVRVSFGMHNTRTQIDQLIGTLNKLIEQLPAVMRQMAG